MRRSFLVVTVILPLFAGCGGDGSSGNNALSRGAMMFGGAQVELELGHWSYYQSRNFRETVEDLNGDGLNDLYFLGYAIEYGQPSLFVGLGGRTDIFEEHTAVAPVAPVALAAASADFNRDGLTDLAALVPGSVRGASIVDIQFFYCRADGTFEPGPFVGFGDFESSNEVIAVGDSNGDHRPDIFLQIGNGLYVLQNQGTGFLVLPIATGTSFTIAAGDLEFTDVNADGFDDLISDDYSSPGWPILRLSHGDGTFGEAHVIAPVEHRSMLTPADLNNDGFGDFVSIAADTLYAYLGDAAGAYTEVRPSAINGLEIYARPFLAGDFDEDGFEDVVILNESIDSSAPRPLSLAKGRGDGTFEAELLPIAHDVEVPTVAADLDRDGHLDIMAVPNGQSGLLRQIYFGNGDGTFRNPSDIEIDIGPGSLMIPILDDAARAPDLDLDGNADLVTSSAGNQSLTFHFGRGDGSFDASEIPWPQDSDMFLQAVLADVDGDGDLDLFGKGTLDGYAAIIRNYGSRDLRALPLAQLAPFRIEGPKVVGDLDNDGRVDLVYARPVTPSTTGIAWYLNTVFGSGDAVFGPETATPPIMWWTQGWYRSGDVNADGIIDVYAPIDPHGGIQVWRGLGNRQFTDPIPTYFGDAKGFSPNAVADLNGDGRLDMASFMFNANATPSSVAIAFGRSDCAFDISQSFPLDDSFEYGTCQLADLDRDHDSDVACLLYVESGQLTYTKSLTLINAGAGAFVSAGQSDAFIQSDYGHQQLSLIDVTADEVPDWVHVNEGIGLSVLPGQGDGTFGPPRYFAAPFSDLVYFGQPLHAVLGDFDGDGDLDVAGIGGPAEELLTIMKNRVRNP